MPQQHALKFRYKRKGAAATGQIPTLLSQSWSFIPPLSCVNNHQWLVQTQSKVEHTCLQQVDTGKYSVYKSYHPLIGTPSWFPPLHVRVHMLPIISDDMKDSKVVETVYDLVPQNATDLSTLLALLRGRCVAAVIRTKTRVQKVPSKRMSFVGVGHRDVQQVNEWIHQWSGCEYDCENGSLEHHDCDITDGCITSTRSQFTAVGMRLVDRNCRHFAWELVQYMLSGSSYEKA